MNGIRTMIVEDEALIALVLQRQLEKLGCVITRVVATGELAVEADATDSPDLVMMDIRLAGAMNGIQAARSILERRATTLVFLTAYQTQEIKEEAGQLPHSGFFQKPLQIQDLQPIIDKLREA